jgi:hypothetical protein
LALSNLYVVFFLKLIYVQSESRDRSGTVAGKKTRKNPIVGCSIPWRRFSGPPRRRSASPHPHSPHLHPSPLPGGTGHLPRHSHPPLPLPGPAPSPRQPTEEAPPPSTRRHSSSPPPSSAPYPCPSSSASRSGRRALPRPVLIFFLSVPISDEWLLLALISFLSPSQGDPVPCERCAGNGTFSLPLVSYFVKLPRN